MKSHKNVLLVDDDPIVNFLHDTLIRKTEIAAEIKICSNGRDALKFLKDFYSEYQRLPDLILLDLHMPVMGGLEFLEIYRRLFLKEVEFTSLWVVSTLFNKKDIEILSGIGFINYAAKPLSLEAIQHLLSSPDLKEQQA